MPPLKTYDLFISHAWSYHAEYNRMVNLIREAANFQWRNYSVPSHDGIDATSTTELEKAIKRQIRPANVFVLLGGVYASHSAWIQYEVAYAQSLNKPIIGVRPYGAERASALLQSDADEIVNWSTVSIVAAVRKWSL